MRELYEIAAWRLKTRRRRPIHPTHVGFWPLAAKLRMSKPPTSSSGEFVAVLLVHRRPANLDLQVRAALHAPSVAEVVVSCNNPDVRPRDWTNIESPRLRILEEAGRNQTRRYAVALASGGDRFVLPDDDVLFTPDALDGFCRALPADGAHPVGLAGQRLLRSGLWESAVEADGEEVDVLNRAYVCTRAHAEGVFDNASALGWSEEDTFSNPADDVLVSFAGDRAPVVKHVPHVNCVSHIDVRISTYQQGGFHSARSEWVAQLRELRHRAPARRDTAARGALPKHESSGPLAPVGQKLRHRFYLGHNVSTLSLLPHRVRLNAGLGDYKAVRSRRLQIGDQPAPLESFVRAGAANAAATTVVGDATHVDLPDGFADEVVAIGALDGADVAAASAALREWRRVLTAGGRLIVGARHAESETVLAALDSCGFDASAHLPSGASLESDPSVSPWKIGAGDDRILDPVPAILDGAADVIVVARAR